MKKKQKEDKKSREIPQAIPPLGGLLETLHDVADFLTEDLKNNGGCDHSVGICCCGEVELLGRVMDLLGQTPHCPSCNRPYMFLIQSKGKTFCDTCNPEQEES